MSLMTLKAQLQFTHRVVVARSVAAHLTYLRVPQPHVCSGVLFGRWPGGISALSLESIAPRGSLDWRQQGINDTNPFTFQTAYIEGWQVALFDFPHVLAPGLKARHVGHWVVLPPEPHHLPLSEAELLAWARQRELNFFQQVRDEGWLTEPRAILIAWEVAGETRCHAYAFDPTGECRRLELDDTPLFRGPAGYPIGS